MDVNNERNEISEYLRVVMGFDDKTRVGVSRQSCIVEGYLIYMSPNHHICTERVHQANISSGTRILFP